MLNSDHCITLLLPSPPPTPPPPPPPPPDPPYSSLMSLYRSPSKPETGDRARSRPRDLSASSDWRRPRTDRRLGTSSCSSAPGDKLPSNSRGTDWLRLLFIVM